MISNVSVNELLFSDLMAKDPVNVVNRTIDQKISRRKIILTGGRGSGKSVILGSREQKSLMTAHPAILTSFDSESFSSNEGYFNKEFMEHYYEVIMSKKLLDYVKEYYPGLFNTKFIDLNYLVTGRLMEVDNYIKNVKYKDIDIKNKLLSGQFVSSILLLFKCETNVRDVTLMLDRFDWTNGGDPEMQSILSNYFDIFERVIITSDDESLISEERTSELVSKGFQIITSTYSKDPNIVKQIIKNRFMFGNSGSNKLPISIINNSDYERLIEISGGNLDMIMASFIDAQIQYRSNYRDDEVTKSVEDACNKRMESMQLLKKRTSDIRLHL